MSVESFISSFCANAPLEWLEHPRYCIHIGYTGPFMSKILLLIIDAHSRWMQVEAGNAASKQNTIEHLYSMFSRFGLPQVMVIDNGTCLTSYEFKEFVRLNHICHLTTVLYHPLSNRLTERAVQTSKFGGMKKQIVQSKQNCHIICSIIGWHQVP